MPTRVGWSIRPSRIGPAASGNFVRMSLRLAPLAGALALLAFAPSAEAALTSSEKGQIKDFVAAARIEDAGKVRSLVARTDLTPEEATAVLSESLAPVPFTEARGAFLREMVFGGASAASRPQLSVATVRATLARAEAIYSKYIGGLDHEPAAINELIGLYGWLDAAVANAGDTTHDKHDVQAGIPAESYDTAAKSIDVHIKANARWLKADAQLPASVGRVRAQVQAALFDMLPDGTTRRVDAANRLGLQGARKVMLTTYGVLLTDNGNLDEAHAQRVQQLLAHMPAARSEIELIYAGEDVAGKQPQLHARGTVVQVAPGSLWPFTGPAPATFDATTGSIAYDLAVMTARRALAARSELRAQTLADATTAAGDANKLLGRPRAPSVEHVLGGAIAALLTDAQIAIDVAAGRAAGGRPESGALFADALGALAVGADGKDLTTVEVGKAGGWVSLTAVKLGTNSVGASFALDGRTFAIDKGSFTKDKAAYAPTAK